MAWLALAFMIPGGPVAGADAASPAPAEVLPYAPARWTGGPSRLTAIRPVRAEHGEQLDFDYTGGPGTLRSQIEDDGRTLVWLSPVGGTPTLPVTMHPVRSLRQEADAIVVELAAAARWTAERRVDGWTLRFGRDTYRPPTRLRTVTSHPVMLEARTAAARAWVDAGTAALADGRPIAALGHFARVASDESHGPLAGSARFQTGVALEAAGLPLSALGAYVDALTSGHRSIDLQAMRAVDRLALEHPGAMQLILDRLGKTSHRADQRHWVAWQTARLLLRRALEARDPATRRRLLEDAAHRLLSMREVPDMVPRARYVMALIALAADEGGWAVTHLEALLAGTTEARLRGHALLALGRIAYADGRGADARDAFTRAAEYPDFGAEAHRALIWQAIADGVPGEELIPRLTPLNLDADGPPQALLLGYLYYRTCHPLRASALASAVLAEETVSRSPLTIALAREQRRLDDDDWDAVRERLRPQIEAYGETVETLARYDHSRFLRQRALRLRASADDMRMQGLSEELKGRGKTTESEDFTMRSRRFVERAPIVNRCALIGRDPSPAM